MAQTHQPIQMQQILDRLISLSQGALTSEHRRAIEDKLNEQLNYTPRIAIFGKTGAGKSSLLNALFGQELSAVSDVEACTREIQSHTFKTPRGAVTLLDCPGVAESDTRDVEYATLYRDLLENKDGQGGVDMILWVLKGDDRAFAADLDFYQRMIRPAMDQSLPLLFVLNQVDKIEPFREWDTQTNTPGAKQGQNIQQKITYVSQTFSVPPSFVVPVSASETYGIGVLMYEMVTRLKSDRVKISLARMLNDNHKTDQVRDEEKKAWWSVLDHVISAIPVVGSIWRGVKSFFRSFF